MSTSDNLHPLVLRQTNVSNPSIIHRQPSQLSISASEDYYSLSESDANDPSRSQATLTRFQTPPSRYRTPLQSRDHLPQQYAVEEQVEEDQSFRKTPMRGLGRRRQSVGEGSNAAPGDSSLPAPAPTQLREGGVRRKPVPSTVIEHQTSGMPAVDPTRARSSIAQGFDREQSPPTPGVDDTPYIHFALDQLTRDEEVRGSRAYVGNASAADLPYSQPVEYPPPLRAMQPLPAQPPPSRQPYQRVPGEVPADAQREAGFAGPPPKSPFRNAQPLIPPVEPPSPPPPDGPNLFVPVSPADARQPALHFLPGILRPLQLGVFIALLLAYLSCLLIAAIWSVIDTGILDYTAFGDWKYFIFRYLPTLIGMLVLFWLIQIQTAVYRIAPFVAMASSSPHARIEGAKLPLQPRGFVLPYFGHFRARQPVIGVFMLIAWLQIFTIPLLASSFNVHYTGRWRWIATQGSIWAVIGLYILLWIASIALLVSLRRSVTGLKWDPRSLADVIVLLERSNALDDADDYRAAQILDGNGEDGAAQLGYWRSTHRPNEIFHGYGIADKAARSYVVEDGRIREKTAGAKRYSDPDADVGPDHQQRWSGVRMLPGHDEADMDGQGKVLPWFLRPSLALLWPVVAVVLLLAFLIVSYLPSTSVTRGFVPALPASVDQLGFSSTNYLYSFLPALLATLCFLFWQDIDMAYRRLQPFAALASTSASHADSEKGRDSDGGHLAEKTLLISYAADLPILVTLSALINGHLRIAWTSLITLLSLALPILAAGIFWAQFSTATSTVRVYADMPAYYALSAFLTIHALAYLAIFPPRSLRASALPARTASFTDIKALVHQSRLLDDLAFRAPSSKTTLVTRLLSASPTASVGAGPRPVLLPSRDAAASKISLADSVRGFARARAAAAPGMAVPRYAFGRYQGRDGRDYVGLDRVRR